MITKEMIRDGFAAGLIQIIDSPHGDGAVCQIGTYWFYFGGETAEGLSAEEYVRDIPKEDIICEIHEVLSDFRNPNSGLDDEYAYYDAYLTEGLCQKKFSSQISKENVIKAMGLVGYNQDRTQKTLTFRHGNEAKSFPGGWEEAAEWVLQACQDEDVALAVNKILFGEMGDYNPKTIMDMMRESLNGTVEAWQAKPENALLVLPQTVIEMMKAEMISVMHMAIRRHSADVWKKTAQAVISVYDKSGEKPEPKGATLGEISNLRIDAITGHRWRQTLKDFLTVDMEVSFGSCEKIPARLTYTGTKYGIYVSFTIDGQQGNYAYVLTENGAGETINERLRSAHPLVLYFYFKEVEADLRKIEFIAKGKKESWAADIFTELQRKEREVKEHEEKE